MQTTRGMLVARRNRILVLEENMLEPLSAYCIRCSRTPAEYPNASGVARNSKRGSSRRGDFQLCRPFFRTSGCWYLQSTEQRDGFGPAELHHCRSRGSKKAKSDITEPEAAQDPVRVLNLAERTGNSHVFRQNFTLSIL